MQASLEGTSWTTLFTAVSAASVVLTAVGIGAGYAAEAYWWPRHRKVFDLPLRPGQLRHEWLGTLLSHLVFVPAFTAALGLGWLRFSSGAAAQLAGFFVPWYAFQVYYYFLHRAMHARPLFWMHRWHHRSTVTTPVTGLSMHPAEAVGWVVGLLGPAALLAHAGWLGAWGYGAFVVLQWTGNLAGHANAEMFPIPASRLSTMLVSNPVSYHALHHARFNGNYCFVSATMDVLFRTEFPDWLTIHRRVFGGRALKALHERGETQAPAP